MDSPKMTYLTSHDGLLQEFHLVMIPIEQAEPVERKGVPQRDALGNIVDNTAGVRDTKGISSQDR